MVYFLSSFTSRLETTGIRISMDGRGRALDNVFVERLWRSVKYEHVYLYGYETVGDRWLGAESRGYRNLIQVTNDGTEDALRWCLEHVPPGQRVVSYLWDDHVIDAFVDRAPPAFELVRRLAEADARRGPSIEDADFLLVGLNNEVTYRDVPSPGELVDRFEPQPVHVVWRGRNHYRAPVVRIYQRRAGDWTPRNN